MKPLIFTASCYVVCDGRVLLHRHKKYGVFLPPGGKLRPGEPPHEAALREVREETGLAVRLLASPPELGDVTALPAPVCCCRAKDADNDFYDSVFFAVGDSDTVAPAAGESRVLRWFTAAELAEAELPPHVRRLAEAALQAASD